MRWGCVYHAHGRRSSCTMQILYTFSRRTCVLPVYWFSQDRGITLSWCAERSPSSSVNSFTSSHSLRHIRLCFIHYTERAIIQEVLLAVCLFENDRHSEPCGAQLPDLRIFFSKSAFRTRLAVRSPAAVHSPLALLPDLTPASTILLQPTFAYPLRL